MNQASYRSNTNTNVGIGTGIIKIWTDPPTLNQNLNKPDVSAIYILYTYKISFFHILAC